MNKVKPRLKSLTELLARSCFVLFILTATCVVILNFYTKKHIRGEYNGLYQYYQAEIEAVKPYQGKVIPFSYKQDNKPIDKAVLFLRQLLWEQGMGFKQFTNNVSLGVEACVELSRGEFVIERKIKPLSITPPSFSSPDSGEYTY